jgi:hypothetical protein
MPLAFVNAERGSGMCSNTSLNTLASKSPAPSAAGAPVRPEPVCSAGDLLHSLEAISEPEAQYDLLRAAGHNLAGTLHPEGPTAGRLLGVRRAQARGRAGATEVEQAAASLSGSKAAELMKPPTSERTPPRSATR